MTLWLNAFVLGFYDCVATTVGEEDFILIGSSGTYYISVQSKHVALCCSNVNVIVVF